MMQYTQERMNRADYGVKSYSVVVTTPTVEDSVNYLIELSKKDKPTKYGLCCKPEDDRAVSREIRQFGDFYAEVVVHKGNSREITEVEMSWC